MPYFNGSYKAPAKPTAKAKSVILKYLKENNLHTLDAIENLLDNVAYMCKWNGTSDEVYKLLNKPENIDYHTEKSFTKLRDTLTNRIKEIRATFPEYVKEQARIRTRDSYLEDIQNLSSIHFPYVYKQYGGSGREYTRNQNITGWESAIKGIFKKNMDRPSEWYQDLYTHLKESGTHTLKFDADEYISMSSHISTWSYWVTLKTTFNDELIESGNCSYRESEHNRV